MQTIEPYFSEMIVEPVDVKQILVSDTGTKQLYGKVLAIGPDVKYTKVGDYVCFVIWGLKDITIDGIKYYFVPEEPGLCLGRVALQGTVPSSLQS